MNSPFVYGKIATGKSFGSRKNDLKRISGNFKNKVNTALISPRRWGKTSLINKVSEEFATFSYYKICFVDIFSVRSEKEFYQHLANEIIRCMADSTEERIELTKKYLSVITPQLALGINNENEFDIQFEFTGKVNDIILHLGNEIAKKKAVTLIICIDNFQNVENFPKSMELLHRLRSSWEKHQHVVYCLYGSKRSYLTKIFTDSSMPFYKFGDLVILEKPSVEEFSSFICERFSDSGKTITKDFAEKITVLMERHPLYVQQLAHIIWESTSTRVDDKILTNSVSELISRNLLLFQKDFDSLSNIQVSFLKALSEGVTTNFTSKEVIQKYNLNSSASTLRAIEGLENKEIIERNLSGIEFSDPAFRLWLKQIWA